MALPRLATSPAYCSLIGAHSFVLGQAAWHYRPACFRPTPNSHRTFASSKTTFQQHKQVKETSAQASHTSETGSAAQPQSQPQSQPQPSVSPADSANFSLPPGWEDNPDFKITHFSQLPHRFFGYNQHIKVNEDFKEALRQILWQFRAPIRYAFAYGSGVFGQKSSGSENEMSPHPNPPKAVEEWQKGGAKVIDFIFGVSYTEHWHSLNLHQHPDHYSGLKYLPYASAAISRIQDNFGAGVYFNPYITVNGTMIKYGVVNLDTLASDLSEWNTLYLAGRLQKPVKILRDDPRIRLANQVNLISALRTALLMLPAKFTERQLYERIAGLSYLGDPRMQSFLGMGASENPNKVSNIVGAQLPGFRQLYVPLIVNLPNVDFTDPRTPRDVAWEKEDAIRHTGSHPQLDNVLGGEQGLELTQDMDPQKRGNMVRRLPKAFRRKLYYAYKKKFQIPGSAFSDVLEQSEDESGDVLRRREGGEFERRIAAEADLPEMMGRCVRATVSWPSTTQSIKGIFTSGLGRSWKYLSDKRKKGKQKAPVEAEREAGTDQKKAD